MTSHDGMATGAALPKGVYHVALRNGGEGDLNDAHERAVRSPSRRPTFADTGRRR
ncbi:MAG: hypothetical protein IPH49_14785 [Ignavibacteria bacterium]|nr:hypothetical protein [Ignavibacteria bacterium]